MTPGYEQISVLRITKTLQALNDPREDTQANQLFFNNRTPDVDAEEGEIMGRFIGRAIIADLIPDDGVAGVYQSGKITFETTEVPKIKQGRNLTESQMVQLDSLLNKGGVDPLFQFTRNILGNILLGIQWRKEYLQVAMRLDSFSYDKLGFKATGVTWGMPADLNVVTTYPWTDATNGDPVGDLLALQLLGRTRYNIDYNRAIMSTQAFRYAIATTKYQNLAKLYIPPTLSFTNLSLLNIAQQKVLFEATTGMEIVLYDQRFWTQDERGNMSSANFLPLNRVIVDSTTNDNNANVMDFANGKVMESQVKTMLPTQAMGVVGGFGGGMRGPVGYATVPPDLNPPNITFWGVARGFPRKYLLQANATLQVGGFVDTIAVGEPF